MNSVPFHAPLYHNYHQRKRQRQTSNPLIPLAPLMISRKRSINQHNKASDKNLSETSTCCVSSNFQLMQMQSPQNYYLKSRYSYRVDASKIKNSGGGGGHEGNSGALETVLKLYTAIKNQNIRQLSDIIDDECQCICNFFSSSQILQGKKQVLDFFTFLIKFLGDHFEFRVQPTLQDGMVVGIHWRLEWSKAHMHLGKGFSFYTCHVYHGKMMIRNVEMFMEPLLHVEPFRPKIFGYMTTIMDIISTRISSKSWKKRVLCALLALLFITTVVLFSKLY